MYLVCLFLIGGLLLMFLSMRLKGAVDFIWVFQLVGIGLFTASIFIFSRFVAKGYIYSLSEDGDLTITEFQGKRRVTVCRLSIAQLSAVEEINASDPKKIAEMKKKIKTEKRKLYNYSIDIVPSKACYIFSDEYEPIAVLFQPDDKMLSYMRIQGSAGTRGRD